MNDWVKQKFHEEYAPGLVALFFNPPKDSADRFGLSVNEFKQHCMTILIRDYPHILAMGISKKPKVYKDGNRLVQIAKVLHSTTITREEAGEIVKIVKEHVQE